MALIGQFTFVLSPTTDKYLELANEEFVRAPSIGDTWTKFRWGIMCSVTADGTSNLANALLVMGMCSGQSLPYGAATTTNFFGAAINSAPPGGGLLTYDAGSGNPYYKGATGTGFKRVGSTITPTSLSSAGSGAAIAVNSGSVQRRTIIYVTLDRVNNLVYCQYLDNATAGNHTIDFAYSHFLDGLEQNVAAPVIAGKTCQAAFVSMTISGVLDNFNLYWNKSAFPLQVYAIAGYKFS